MHNESISADRRVLDHLLTPNVRRYFVAPTRNNPKAAFIGNFPDWPDNAKTPIVADFDVRLYCCSPEEGGLILLSPPRYERIHLSNLTLSIRRLRGELWEATSVVAIAGSLADDDQYEHIFQVAGPDLQSMQWLKDHFGPRAWYREDLVGHCLEGWLATTQGEDLWDRMDRLTPRQ